MSGVNLEYIDLLADDLSGYAGKTPSITSGLEQRRRDLLEMHLGYKLPTDLPHVYVIGDSHSGFFTGAEVLSFHKGPMLFTSFFRARYVNVLAELLPVFRVFHLGPATAWNAMSKGSSTKAWEKFNMLLRRQLVPRQSTVLLTYGEIDIRCQIPKTILSGAATLEGAVDATINKFIRLPLLLKDRGYTPVVWLPTLNSLGTPDSGTQDLPFIGSQALRDEVTDFYCSELNRRMKESGIKSVGLSKESPVPVDERYSDRVHLSQNMMPETLKLLIENDVLPLMKAESSDT